MNSTKPGLIVDIGLGGLSFRYIDRKDWPEESHTLDIVSGEDEEFRLENIPYRVVSDYETRSDIAYEKMIVKRRSVAFGPLSNDQKMKLQQFIDLNQATFN
ncbi:MAG: hypothetical protein KKG47_03270 [Proteobacteria bacterium]|nr:hypothetical protein [Pseudomonadota bacterium]MBU1739030.1 hypothetical protein [Pseudomonadota bacterium]